jgi:predicted Fe-Mo cluster-binding NifX family protein
MGTGGGVSERTDRQNPPGKKGDGKIAICAFEERICPRFDMTREVLILDERGPEKKPGEKMYLPLILPEDRLRILVRKGVQLVIVGGIQERFQQMFQRQKVEVIWGVMGKIEDVIQAYRQGLLYSGVGPVPKPPGSRFPKE